MNNNKIFSRIIYNSIIKLCDDIIQRLNLILTINLNMDDMSIVKDIKPLRDNVFCKIESITINDLILELSNSKNEYGLCRDTW